MGMTIKQLIEEIEQSSSEKQLIDFFSQKTDQQLLDLVDILKDNIETKKDMHQPYQNYSDRLQIIRDIILSRKYGNKQNNQYYVSNEVYGHPSATSNPKHANLIPIKVKDVETVNRYIERADKILSDLQKNIAINSAKKKGTIKATKKEKENADLYLKSANKDADKVYIDLIRNETLPELYRLHKLFD